jgi:Uma2 family endonuclease
VGDNRQVSTAANARRFTVAEYLRMAEIGILRPDERVELIDGQIVAMSPQGPTHGALVSRLSRRLMSMFPEDRFCVRPQCTMAAGEDYAPEPDLAVVAGRCEDHERELPRTAVLVIEVAESSLRLDRGRKSDLYGRAGVLDYWIIDLVERKVEVRREPSPAGFKLIRILQPEDTVLPLVLEGSNAPPLRVADLLPV